MSNTPLVISDPFSTPFPGVEMAWDFGWGIGTWISPYQSIRLTEKGETMAIEYQIDHDFGGVPEGWKFAIDDTPEAEREWRDLLAAFENEFSEFTLKGMKDFEFADSHYEMRSVFACLYNEGFYSQSFIPRVQRILRNQEKECYAKLECYDQALKTIGSFMVFKNKVIFDELAERTGLLKKLVGL